MEREVLAEKSTWQLWDGIKDIPSEHVVPYVGFIDDDFTFMHSNAKPYTARVQWRSGCPVMELPVWNQISCSYVHLRACCRGKSRMGQHSLREWHISSDLFLGECRLLQQREEISVICSRTWTLSNSASNSLVVLIKLKSNFEKGYN